MLKKNAHLLSDRRDSPRHLFSPLDLQCCSTLKLLHLVWKSRVKVRVSSRSHQVLSHQDICFLFCSSCLLDETKESQHLISRFTVVKTLDEELFSLLTYSGLFYFFRLVLI